MKEVTYEYKITSGRYIGNVLRGTITEKPTGEPKISIRWAKDYPNSDVWKARALGKQIIDLKYEHPSVTDIKEIKAELVDIIKQHTAEMRDLYYERVKERSVIEFQTIQSRNNRSIKEWYEAYRVEFDEVEQGGRMVIKPKPTEYHQKRLYKMRDAIEATRKVVNDGLPTYMEKMQKLAELHYESSTFKLARRITDKGLNQELIEVTSGKVGVNLEILITDGTKTIKCFTIVAEGEIQKAHYRYLIKDRK